MHLTPAEVAIRLFKTPMRLSRAIGAAPAAPFHWMAERRGRSTRGDIPVPQIRRIMEVAREQGLEVLLEHLVYGCDVPDEAPVLAGSAATAG